LLYVALTRAMTELHVIGGSLITNYSLALDLKRKY
jgi:ATP-dependent exoDNAse (exonuclease V) beta subunit